jgi:AcrR family transcriptional regulator
LRKKRNVKSVRYHHGNLRDALVRVAVKFLENKSVDDLSLRKLATAAGVSQAAPYRHFKDKESLLAAISQEGFEQQFAQMLQVLRAHEGDGLKLLHSCARSYFQIGLEHPQHFRLMMSSRVCPTEEHPELQMAAFRSYALLKLIVERCQKLGVVGSGDPYHKALHCWIVVHGFTTLYVEDRLSWLGVTGQNAFKALSTLIEQFRIGHESPLVAVRQGFGPLQGLDFKNEREGLKMAEIAILKEIEES